jgi:hypothetical protein
MFGMFGKFALVLSIGATIIQAPINTPAAQCCSPDSPQKEALADGCCAAMNCCVISDGAAAQPITAALASNDINTFPAPICGDSLIDLQPGQQGTHFAIAQPVAHSPPPLALLCTRLI